MNEPCPFCGTDCKAIIIVEENGRVSAECLNCRAQGPVKYSRMAAEAAWDSRKAEGREDDNEQA